MTVKDDGKEHKQWPAIRRPRRISRERYERLLALLRYFREGKSVQEIAAVTGWKKDRIYHEMYSLKNLGLLDTTFKNPASVHGDIVEALRKEVKNGDTDKL